MPRCVIICKHSPAITPVRPAYGSPRLYKHKIRQNKVKQCRRDLRRGNYEEIRKSLALIDWNDKMNNKTATECWNILRGELDSAIDSYVPMKKQGKRSKKKHLSKEAFRKIIYKQNMWRVYKHTGTDKDYDVSREKILVRYLYQKQSSRYQRGKGWGS